MSTKWTETTSCEEERRRKMISIQLIVRSGDNESDKER